MSWPGSPRALRDRRTYLLLPAIVFFAGLMAAPAGLGVPVSPPMAAPHAGTYHAAAVHGPALAHINHPAVHAAASSGPTYYSNNTSIAPYPQNLSGAYCYGYNYYYIYEYCYPNSADPQALSLANGNIGLTYEMVTSINSTTCPNNASFNSTSRIGFTLSSDGGASWGATNLINAIGNATCPFVTGIEPASTVQSNGTIDVVYVGANASRSSLFTTYPGSMTYAYTHRASDALVLQRSYNNGTSWTNGTIVAPNLTGEANLARPAIATFGQTIYIAYENISNGTSLLPGTYTYYASYPVSIDVIVSEDGGTTWQGPFNVPGENLTNFDTANSPSLAVSPSGELAVAYATNRSCYAYCNLAGSTAVYGEDVVAVTSSNNASTFSAIRTIATVASPTEYGYSYANVGFVPTFFEYASTTASAWDPTTGNLYVAFTGADNATSGMTYGYGIDYDHSQVWVGASTDSGVTWTATLLGHHIRYSSSVYDESYFNPGLAVHNGTLYVTYTYRNVTSNGGGCSYGSSSASIPSAYSQYATSSTDGVHFASPLVIDFEPHSGGYAYNAYPGWYSSVAFNATGSPVYSYSIGTENYAYSFIPPVTYIYQSAWNVSVAIPYRGPTVSATFNVTGLGAGARWGFTIDGNAYNTTASSLAVAGIPAGRGVLIQSTIPTVSIGYEVIREATGSGLGVFYNNSSTWTFNITTLVGFNLNPEPANFPYADFNLYDFSSKPTYDFYYYWDTYVYAGHVYHYQGGCSFPWYLPVGFNMTWSSLYSYPKESEYYTDTYIGYWSGTGNGSYTGATATAPITIHNQAINETFWMLGGGTYGVNFEAPTLASTSTYSFDFNGSSWSSSGGLPVQVLNVSTGPHYVTDIAATSAQTGWQYFGWTTNNPVVVPTEPYVNLSFAYVNTGTAAGTVGFHANGLTAGTVWSFSFNGTTYSSATPWINISGTHTGSYPVSAFPVTSENGSAGYLPSGVAPTMNVTAGHTYLVNFTSAFQVNFLAGTGGSISGANSSAWELPGTVLTASASVAPGYGWAGWTGVGVGSYSGFAFNINVTANGPIVETANFYPLNPNRFNLTFTETGVPAGTAWSVFLDGVGYTSTGASLNVPNVFSCALSGNLGRYSLVVPYAYLNGSTNLTRFVPLHYASSVCGGTTVPLAFQAQYFVTLESTPGGGVSASSSTEFAASSAWFLGGGSTVTLQATPASGAWRFIGWNGTGTGSYTGTSAQAVVSLIGPITEFATFQKVFVPPPKTYNLTFTEVSTLAAGTEWRVSIGTTAYASTSSSILVTGLLPQTYTVTVAQISSPDGQAQYTPTLPSQQVTISTQNKVVSVSYKAEFWVAVTVVGPGTVSPTSGWEPQGAQLTINASGDGTAVFKGWTGTGAGAYSGLEQQTVITVNNSMSEVATFVAHAPPPGAVVTSIWTGTGLIAGLAVAGLLAGLVVGVVIARARRGSGGRGSAAPTAGASTPAEPEPESVAPATASEPYVEGPETQESYMEGPEGPSGGGSA